MVKPATIVAVLLSIVAALTADTAAPAPDGDDLRMPRRWLPVDADGWTVLQPAADARLIYVSSTAGDDASAKTYTPGSTAVGDDPFLPAGPIRPFVTLAAALERARPDHGDWVLLKRGETWTTGTHRLPNGRSAEAPFVMTAYGPADQRPVLKGFPRLFMGHFKPGRSGRSIVLEGLDLYHSMKDPQSPDYAVVKGEKMGHAGIRMEVGAGGSFKNVLVENCRLRFAMISGINYAKSGRDPNTPVVDVVIRRSLILDHYTVKGHTVGIWANDWSMLLEQCILDHNGWLNYRTAENRANQEPGIAIGLSHNTYLCNIYNTVFRGNMFLRGASQGNKWSSLHERAVPDILLDDNLYVANEFGLSAGGNGTGGHRFVNFGIINNVFTHFGKAKGTVLGHGVGITDWDGGLIAGNLFRGPRFAGIKANAALNIGSRQWRDGRGGGTVPPEKGTPPATPGKGHRNVRITRNTFYDMDGRAPLIGVRPGLDISPLLEQMSFTHNRLQMPGLDKTLIDISRGEIAKFTFAHNAYHAAGDAWFTIDGRPVSFDEWVKRTGEHGATDKPVPFPHAQRSVLSYMEHLGYEPTLEAFYRECRQQSKRHWRPAFTAPAVNAWIREGFGMARLELERDDGGRYALPFRPVDP